MRNASSGTTAITTSGDTAVDVTLTPSGEQCRAVQIVAAVAGFISFDNGTVYHPFSTGRNVFPFPGPFVPTIKVKRIPSGTDLSATFVSTWG